jgi:hypothetical protein
MRDVRLHASAHMSEDTITWLVVAVCAAIAAASIAAAITAVHWLTKSVTNRAARYALRGVGIALATLGLAPTVFTAVASTFTRGDFVCVTCGHAVHRSKLLGVRFHIEPAAYPRGIADSDDRYRQLVRQPSEERGEHDWMGVGCHSIGFNIVACTEIGSATWFAALPAISDRAWACRLAQQLVASPPDERAALVLEFDSRFEDHAPTEDEFDRWYEGWHRSHPEWPARVH